MPLIDRYKDFPEGETRDLLSRLDPYFQERLEVLIYTAPPPLCRIEEVKDLKISSLFAHDRVFVHCIDENEKPISPDPYTQAILDRLGFLVQLEYDGMQGDSVCAALMRLQGALEHRKGKDDPHP